MRRRRHINVFGIGILTNQARITRIKNLEGCQGHIDFEETSEKFDTMWGANNSLRTVELKDIMEHQDPHYCNVHHV